MSNEKMNNNGEMSDKELESVSGGGLADIVSDHSLGKMIPSFKCKVCNITMTLAAYSEASHKQKCGL